MPTDTNTFKMGTVNLNTVTPINSVNTVNSENIKPVNPVPLSDSTVPASTYKDLISNSYNTVSNAVSNLQGQYDSMNQQGMQDTNTIANLQSLLGGKDLALSDAYQANGLPELQKQTQQQLAKLKEYQAQIDSLNIDRSVIPTEIAQQDKTNNMVRTSAGLAPVTYDELQKNALQSANIARNALSAGVLYDKLNTDYQTTKDLITQRINAVYAQKEADIQSKLTNLQGLREFGLSATQSKLADATQRKLKLEQEQLNIQKEKEKQVEQALMNASMQGAPQAIVNSARTVSEKGGTPEQVIATLGQWAGDFWKIQLLKENLKTEKLQQAKISYSMQTPSTPGAVIDTLPKAQQERYYKLQNDYDQATKNYRGAIDAANNLQALASAPTPQAQTAIIFQYMKTLDPNSTVREGEFALVGKTAGLSDRAVNALKRLDSGSRLNTDQIKQITDAANLLADVGRKNLSATSQEYDRRASKFGLPNGLFYETSNTNDNSPESNYIKTLDKVNSQQNNTQPTSYLNSLGLTKI